MKVVLMILGIVSVHFLACKPMETENLRSPPSSKAHKDQQTEDLEASFPEWTGRSDLKADWIFENVP